MKKSPCVDKFSKSTSKCVKSKLKVQKSNSQHGRNWRNRENLYQIDSDCRDKRKSTEDNSRYSKGGKRKHREDDDEVTPPSKKMKQDPIIVVLASPMRQGQSVSDPTQDINFTIRVNRFPFRRRPERTGPPTVAFVAPSHLQIPVMTFTIADANPDDADNSTDN